MFTLCKGQVSLSFQFPILRLAIIGKKTLFISRITSTHFPVFSISGYLATLESLETALNETCPMKN